MKKIIVLLIIFFIPNAALAVTQNVVVIGDSITQVWRGGVRSERMGYRYWLWRSLALVGADFAYVGSQSMDYNGYISRPRCGCVLFDQSHEGHWGWKADDVATALPTWLAGYAPDIAIIHIGTNDVYYEESVATIEGDYEDIITALRADNANIKIFLAKIIPRTDCAGCHDKIDALIADLPTWVAGITSEQSPVVLVDCHTGFDTVDDSEDGIHPDESGEQKIGAAFFAALEGVLY